MFYAYQFSLLKGENMKGKQIKRLLIAFVICMIAITSVKAYVDYHANAVQVDNGYYPNGEFGKLDKKKSPIVNMTILLKLLNTANFCDEDWFEQVRALLFIMGAQVDMHIEDDDEFVHELMVKQKRIVIALKAIEGKYPATQVKLEDIDELEAAYNDYHDYYYQHYNMGGADNE